MADLEIMMKQMMEQMGQMSAKLDSQTSELTQTRAQTTEVVEKMGSIKEEIQETIDNKLSTRTQAVFDVLSKKIDKKLDDALDNIQASIGQFTPGNSRREEVRQGKQPAGTSGQQGTPFVRDSESNRPDPRRYEPFTPIYDSSQEDEQENRRGRRNRDEIDDDLSSIKVQVPPFHGTANPDDYLDWKSKCETIFSCQRYSERKKVQLAVIEFRDYAHIWWSKKVAKWQTEGIRPPSSWEDLTRAMDARFLPSTYHEELKRKILSLKQEPYCS